MLQEIEELQKEATAIIARASDLNVLEEQRKLNETFDGIKKGWTEANRPKLEWKTKIFYKRNKK